MLRRIILSLLLAPAFAFAQPFQWTTFTSTSNVVEMIVLDGRVWMATSGGLSAYNAANGTFEVYTNTRGLAMNQCTAIGKDAQGFIWVAHADARITRLNPVTGNIVLITDLQDEVFEITGILDVGNSVFVSANNGLYRFAYYAVVDNYRVQETMRALGTFPGETRVSCLAADGNYLYAGTQYGIARASLTESQLSAPAVWTNWTTVNSPLPENNIQALHGISGEHDWLLVATPSWLAVFRDTLLFNQTAIGGISAFADGSTPLAAAPENILSFNAAAGSSGEWRILNGRLPGLSDMDVLLDGADVTYVAGLANASEGIGGIRIGEVSVAADSVVWGSTQRAPGIGGNFITTLALDAQERLWAGGPGDAPGIFVRDGENWRNYSPSTGYTHGIFSSTPTGFVFDNNGGTWASCMGSGVAWFIGDSIYHFTTWDTSGFEEKNGQLVPRLSGIAGQNGNLYVETYLARNAAGDVYITNLEAVNGNALVRVPHEWIAQGNNRGMWTYYWPRIAPYPTDFPAVGRVLVDPLQRIWAGAGRNGLKTFVVDEQGTPSDTSNDSWFAYTPADLGDPVTCYEEQNKEVLSWAVDGQGYLWIGTINGVYYTQGGVPYDISQLQFVCVVDLPVGHRVNAIHVDAHDNKWFGTDEGVAVLDKNFMWIHAFQTAGSTANRSDLVSENVLAITSNARTGEVWIGTSDGLSRFTSPYVSRGGDLGDLWPFPNPFRADGKQRMRVDPQRLGGRFDELRVFTISGRLVRKVSWSAMTDPGSGGGWDGRNDDGELVAGGVYLLIASANDGKSAIGKVAVLGR
jgi:ligand-binding sensor domain-containing protein